ncbi:hypothetical protein [Jannaschia sp. R86511]|uniref:aldose epimerase family protein n=1 Tax=Jannaschia sp. R86511 TaxID=3093853 RepID=UPI0036D3621C
MTEPAVPPATALPPDPCAPRQVTGADGASFRFCAHGGHVLGWVPAGGAERLWLSRDTGCGPRTAIRGGVPVVWPQFAERGDGPRHGVARDRTWSVLHAGPDAGPDADGVARARLELRADAATRVLFPHPFTLTLDVEAAGDRLRLALTAGNDGVEPFTFTAALHGYLAVSSTATARVAGLEGASAHHNDGSGTSVLPDAPLPTAGPVDLAVTGDADVVRVVDPGLGDLVMSATGFDSWVVWNPGADSAPGDVHAGGATEFVCVEPARLDPVTLPPGGRWAGVQTLRSVQPAG